jgi:hypothetical protein
MGQSQKMLCESILVETVQELGRNNRDFEEAGTRESNLSYKSAKKLPQKKILAVQVESGKIIRIDWTLLCFV